MTEAEDKEVPRLSGMPIEATVYREHGHWVLMLKAPRWVVSEMAAGAPGIANWGGGGATLTMMIAFRERKHAEE